MRALRLLTIVGVVFLVGGCVRSMQPILADDQVLLNNDIVGNWVTDKGDETVVVSAPQGDDKVYKVLYTDKDGKKGAFLCRLGKVGDLLLAELHPDEPAPDATPVYKAHVLSVYSFLLLQQTKPNLVVSVMSQDWLDKYLKDHSGELQTIQWDKDNRIVTASTAAFQAFLLKHVKDDKAMGDPSTFVRPGDPATRSATNPK